MLPYQKRASVTRQRSWPPSTPVSPKQNTMSEATTIGVRRESSLTRIIVKDAGTVETLVIRNDLVQFLVKALLEEFPESESEDDGAT